MIYVAIVSFVLYNLGNALLLEKCLVYAERDGVRFWRSPINWTRYAVLTVIALGLWLMLTLNVHDLWQFSLLCLMFDVLLLIAAFDLCMNRIYRLFLYIFCGLSVLLFLCVGRFLMKYSVLGLLAAFLLAAVARVLLEQRRGHPVLYMPDLFFVAAMGLALDVRRLFTAVLIAAVGFPLLRWVLRRVPGYNDTHVYPLTVVPAAAFTIAMLFGDAVGRFCLPFLYD